MPRKLSAQRTGDGVHLIMVLSVAATAGGKEQDGGDAVGVCFSLLINVI